MEAGTLEQGVGYKVKTEQFEGPLDLLLDLIEKRKLFINDIALAQVADDYVAHIRRFDAFPVADVANFLIVASTLLLIKSRSLLPEITLNMEEEASIDDLKRRLALYEIYRELAQVIRAQYGKTLLFARTHRPNTVTVFAPDKRLTPGLIHAKALDALNALPKAIVLPKVTVKKIISLEEMIDRMESRIKSALKMSFGEFTSYGKAVVIPKEKRVEIIVGFLAMLELVKQGILAATQHEQHGDINMETYDLGVPTYHSDTNT